MNDVMDHIRDGYDTTLGPKIQHLRQYQQEAHWPTETYLESKGFIYEGYLFMMPANHARASFTVCSNQHGNYIANIPLDDVSHQRDKDFIAYANKVFWTNGQWPPHPVGIYSKGPKRGEAEGKKFYVGQYA